MTIQGTFKSNDSVAIHLDQCCGERSGTLTACAIEISIDLTEDGTAVQFGAVLRQSLHKFIGLNHRILAEHGGEDTPHSIIGVRLKGVFAVVPAKAHVAKPAPKSFVFLLVEAVVDIGVAEDFRIEKSFPFVPRPAGSSMSLLGRATYQKRIKHRKPGFNRLVTQHIGIERFK